MTHASATRDDLFTSDHDLFRRTVAEFVRTQCDPHAEEWNERGEIPREVWREMGELGFLGTSFPEEYGGTDADLMYSVILAEELTRSRVSGLAMAVCDHKDMSSNYILEASNEEVRARYIPRCVSGEWICGIGMTEPGGGSDLAALKTTAVRDGDHYVVNGQKAFTTNGYFADVVIVAVRTDPAASLPHRGISLLVVEAGTPGFTKGSKLHKLGTLASDTTDLYFQDCRVPVENLLGEENGGFKILMADLGLERLIASAMYVTACEEMLRQTSEYCRQRIVFGQPVSSHQANRHRLAELYTETELARTYYYECCRTYMSGEPSNRQIAMIKLFAAELANKVAYECLTLHGGYGYSREYPIAQWYADVRLYNLGAGTPQIMKEIIAKELGI